jgi:hypothetical protein
MPQSHAPFHQLARLLPSLYRTILPTMAMFGGRGAAEYVRTAGCGSVTDKRYWDYVPARTNPLTAEVLVETSEMQQSFYLAAGAGAGA